VHGLLRQYLEAREDAAAIPAQVATMVKRLIGDLGSNLPSIQSRMLDTLKDLHMTVPKVSSEYVKSLREVANSLTGFTQLSKTTILPKLKQFLGTVGPTWNIS
jgi:predicted PurR-regulated permease PerM